MKEQYISYSAFQFASDDVFIAWVMYGANAPEWEKWLRQHTHIQAITAQARQMVLDLERLPQEELSETDQHQLWDKILGDISTSSTGRSRWSIKRGIWIAIAAAAAILLLLWVGNGSSPKTVIAQAGEHPEIVLPESSHIQLNAGSSLSYNEKRFSKDRQLTLSGEGFFKVHPGSKFTVHTARGSVTVLGTSFNVIAWPDRFEVTCYTGKVKIEDQNHSSVVITPGQRCIQDGSTGTLMTNTVTLAGGEPEWMHGKFVFDNQPLKIVAKELERQYHVNVKLAQGLEDLKYVGLFESGNVDTALSLITWPLHLKAEKNGDTILIGR
jgi:transmembrane sensor